MLVKLKDASVYLEKMGKKLKIDLYELKPDWFTDLDKEVFLEIKKWINVFLTKLNV